MKKKILILGDSHAHVFKAGKFAINFPDYDWSLCYVMGATLLGLSNPKSKTQAMQQYSQHLESINPDIVITLLGEVDIGYHIWFRNKTKNEPVEDSMNRALSNYKTLWDKIKEKTDNIICLSIPLPTIPDMEKVGDVALSRKFVDATQIERTNATLLFNNKLSIQSKEQNLNFLDLDTQSIGEDGYVKKELLHPNRFDHHYYGLTYSNLLIENLKKYL